MEENRTSIQSNWELVEDIAKTVYRSKIRILTENDIKRIEESIDNGTPLFVKNSGAGEMNLDTGIIFNSVSIGFDAIQTVVAILTFWYTARKFNLVSNKEQAPDDKLNSEQIDPSIVEDIVKGIINKHHANEKVEEELRKNGKRIIAAIVSHLKAIKRTDPKNNDKKED